MKLFAVLQGSLINSAVFFDSASATQLSVALFTGVELQLASLIDWETAHQACFPTQPESLPEVQ
jgi:hypothetical protein